MVRGVLEPAQSRIRNGRRVRSFASLIVASMLMIAGLLLGLGQSAQAEDTTTTTESTTTTSSSSSSSTSSIEVSTTTSSPTTTSGVTTSSTRVRPNASSTTSSSSTSSSTTSSSTTTIARSTEALPGFNRPNSGGGLSTGVKLSLVIVGLLLVATGFVVLTVIYWRRTRPVMPESPPADLA